MEKRAALFVTVVVAFASCGTDYIHVFSQPTWSLRISSLPPPQPIAAVSAEADFTLNFEDAAVYSDDFTEGPAAHPCSLNDNPIESSATHIFIHSREIPGLRV